MKSIFSVIILLLCISCDNDKNAFLKIITIDNNNTPLKNTSVKLYIGSDYVLNNSIDTTLFSEQDGSITFEYAFECYLTAHAIYSDSVNVYFNDKEYHLIPGKNIEDTLILWK